MNGWAILILLAVVTGGGLWRFGRFPRVGLELLGAMLLFAAAGYAWQGHPGLAGRPTPPPAERGRPDGAFATMRATMFERFGNEADVLATADAFHRQGLDSYAIGILRGALTRNPRSAAIWVGLGNALIDHADGLVTPAAELAFARAMALAPDHPGAPFFLGLAYARSGQLERARTLWTGLLARTPPQAPWRPLLAAQVAALDAALR